MVCRAGSVDAAEALAASAAAGLSIVPCRAARERRRASSERLAGQGAADDLERGGRAPSSVEGGHGVGWTRAAV